MKKNINEFVTPLEDFSGTEKLCLTVGKIYRVIDKGGVYNLRKIINDQGEEINVFLKKHVRKSYENH